MSSLSRNDARTLIGKIREENGGISPADRAACPPAVLRALENVRRKLGAATKTLATNLYSKDTRFVYELIQNAEDNNYTRAEESGTALYLSFNVFPNKIVIESNEDGFAKEHVRAICSTGESTKTVTQGYIGEKGIGFKSVFKVAKKVHIQSGPFSFSFEYTRGSSDDGLGMVTPLDEDYDDLPEHVHTSITLTLLDPSNFVERVHDLLNIPDTLLLFLTKLNVLHINIYPPNSSKTEIKFHHSVSDEDSLEYITKTTTIDGNSEKVKQYFYVVRKEINNLPHDEARSHNNQASVVLAFPVDREHESIIKQQHVFAFLPLRLAGFTFLIHSDFITQASREDIFHSTRNKRLLSGVAETFRDAVLRFCDHPSLQYQWMRYLPSDSISDEFWKNLRPQIVSLLINTCCLRPWSEVSLFLPSQLHLVIDEFKDRQGDPLFADSIDESYLSRNYTSADFDTLISLGTRKMDFRLVIERIRSDLRKPDSKMKTNTADGDWHTRVAKLLSKLLESASPTNIDALRSLNLIPLQDRRWVSARTTPIFLPGTKKCPIPSDLGLDLVQPLAALVNARTILFSQLGVKSARPHYIISLINKRYGPSFRCNIDENIAHLRYLFWHLSQDVLNLDKNIFLMDQDGIQVHRTGSSMKHMYFKEEEEVYGPLRLFESYPLESPDAPGLTVHFLNVMYLQAVRAGVQHHGRSWKQWLTECADVQNHPQLLDPTYSTISREFQYVMKHRPEHLVGLLKRYWSSYESVILPSVVKKIGRCWVPSDQNLALSLRETFLPLPILKRRAKILKVVDFPFLSMPEELTHENGSEWQFLDRFGVRSNGGSDKLHFYIEALTRIADENKDGCGPDIVKAIFRAYSSIEQLCSSSADATYVRDYFENKEMIFIPSSEGREAEWVHREACVWTAPEWLEARRRLNGVPEFEDCKHLFRAILEIGDADWKDYLRDLETLKENNDGNIKKVECIYRCLCREFERDSAWERIRTLFEDSALVFVPSKNTWHPLSSCIWAEDEIQIPQKIPIKTPYGNLEDFFCGIMGVPTPNLEMHVQALKELAKSRPPPSASEIKRMIMLISSMDPNSDDIADLRTANIFSVAKTNGQKTFTNAAADFAIIDRLEYGSAFAGKIRMLDFSMEEVRASRSFLRALNMQRRYLSEMVVEATTVRDGAINIKLSWNFRLKAFALFRFAVHYQSQNSRDGDTSLYNKLQSASMFVSDDIFKSISVVQYGETVTVEESRANFHLYENENELRLYVPRDETAQEECFFRQLPRGLMKFFAISDPSAEAVLTGVIGCTRLIAVDAILTNAGVVNIDGIAPASPAIRRTEQAGYDGILHGDSTETSAESQTSRRSCLALISTRRSFRAPQSEVDEPGDMPRRTPSLDSRSSPSSTSSISGFDDSIFRGTGYASLLERVIRSAERVTIPAQGSYSLDNSENAFPPGLTSFESIFTTRSVERDRKVGAAGELLIYEILRNLGLYRFTAENWKSTIRKEVCVHNKYRDLEAWFGRETADITYLDRKGDLTKLFIEKGYLQSEIWEAEKPTYYLEVKTTTRDSSEQFYMSGSQYRRMQDMQLRPNRTSSNVYVILRVFNLEGRIGLRVYVDPVASRRRGELEFHVDTWAVRPAGNFMH